MSTADYLSLLDWTARQTRKDKRVATPKKIAPIFDRLGISAEIWCRLVKDFGKLFSLFAGPPQRIDEHRSKGSSRCYRMRQEARELIGVLIKSFNPTRRDGFRKNASPAGRVKRETAKVGTKSARRNGNGVGSNAV